MVYCLCGTGEIKLQIWGNNRTYLGKMEYCFLRAKLKRERDNFFFFLQNKMKEKSSLWNSCMFCLFIRFFMLVFSLHIHKN